MEKIPQRKTLRLQDYDYSQQGMYYITICTKNREQILSKIINQSKQNNVGVGVPDDPNTPKHITKNNVKEQSINIQLILQPIGEITEKIIHNINKIYDDIKICDYIIMPDHIHMTIIVYKTINGSSRTPTPTNKKIPFLISTLKRFINKQIGDSIWQRNYYEHIIRNEKEYFKIKKYILENPIRWYRKGIANEITNPNCNIYNNNTSNNNGSIRIYNNRNINNKHTNQLRYNPKQCNL